MFYNAILTDKKKKEISIYIIKWNNGRIGNFVILDNISNYVTLI